MLAFITGLLAGALHVWSGPDHLTAIAPLAVSSQKKSWTTGFRWGIGHSLGVAIVGGLTLILREIIPVEAISGWSERLVGVMLILIGIWGFRKAFKTRIHTHTHKHDGDEHKHIHIHSKPKLHEKPEAHIHMHAALGIGILHGFAGSSHFVGILPALAFSTTIQSVIYIVAFGIGTIISMVLFASGIGFLSDKFAFNSEKAYKWLLSICSSAAFLVGVFWLIY
jgi:sulfite exporter TauE/SafE